VLRDDLLLVGVVLGLGGWVGVNLGPATGPSWYARALRAWGRRRSVGVDFVLGPGRRLREGPEVEAALGRLYVRQLSATFVALAGFSLSLVLLLHGPHLSESTPNSLAVAGSPLLGTLVAVLYVHGFTEPYRTEGGEERVATVEDYVWPVTRAVAWVVAGASAVVPVGAVLLAVGPAYDAGKVFWEGLVAGPLACTALVVALEHWLGRVTDAAEPGDPTLYVWDAFRARAAKLLLAAALGNGAVGFNRAIGGLNGVAVVGSGRAWVDEVSVVCYLLQVLATVGFLLVLVQPLAPRLRARLWPTLTGAARVEFGRALPIP
jgi:hypothetical protein